jgi:phage tail-like protein
MAVTKQAIKANYPLPVYNYRVTIGSLTIGVSEISGLSIEYEPVTYKHGLSFVMGPKIIPGMRQPTRLTLKRAIVKNNAALYGWLRETYADPFKSAKRDLLIDLCDEAGAPLVRWKVQGALPVKIDAPAFDANSTEAAIETIELIAQDVQIEYVSA